MIYTLILQQLQYDGTITPEKGARMLDELDEGEDEIPYDPTYLGEGEEN